MSYLYEMHFHTSQVSGCGRVKAEDGVELLKNEGYSGVVVTDHLVPTGFSNQPITNWKEYVDRYLEGYKCAKTLESESFHVLLGAEICFPENENDYLLFGITEDFLYTHPYINRLTLSEFSAIAKRNGVLIVQAHPMRNDMTIMNPNYLDGYEVYNGNKRHNSRNNLADQMAEMNGKIKTSGSDFHQLEDLARGGIYFNTQITSEQQLVLALQEQAYTLRTIE
ncbi:MAG: PHP domain-containing protein [Clostridia bacterium]|nr:PHP domain-containing protein [Clostridia bacterium]